MQDTQLLLPVRLRRKHLQKENDGHMRASRPASCSSDTFQHVWKPAGCHSLHTNGVERVHLLHPLAGPLSHSSARKSCSSSVCLSSNKENKPESLKTSRIFKQRKSQSPHPKSACLEQQANIQLQSCSTQRPSTTLSAHSFISDNAFSHTSSSTSTGSCRPVLKAISNTYAAGTCSSVLQSGGNKSPQQQHSSRSCHIMASPHSSIPLDNHQEPSSTLSFSSSSCSGYTPGTRGAPTPEYAPPLRAIVTASEPHVQKPDSVTRQYPYLCLHSLARQVEQQAQSSANIPAGKDSTLYNSNHLQENSHHYSPHAKPLAHHQRNCMVERASSPIQFLGEVKAAADIAQAYSRAASRPQGDDPNRVNDLQHQQCISDNIKQHRNVCSVPGQQQQQHSVTAVFWSRSSNSLLPLPCHKELSADIVALEEQEHKLCKVQHLPQCQVADPACNQFTDVQQVQQGMRGCHLSLKELDQQQRRQQWKVHQQQQMQQQWLDHLEHQRCLHDNLVSTAEGNARPDQLSPQNTATAATAPPAAAAATASPAAAAAARAIADYKRILGEAQAMAQKSAAAWAQLNSYHQQRVWGRLPGSRGNSGCPNGGVGSMITCCTPTPAVTTRQRSRMGRVACATAASFASEGEVATGQKMAASTRPFKSLEAAPCSGHSPDSFHTPTGEINCTSKRCCESPANVLCKTAATADRHAAAAADGRDAGLRRMLQYRDIPSLPGSPAAMVAAASRFGSCSSKDSTDALQPGVNSTAKQQQQLQDDDAHASVQGAAPSQMLLQSLEATRAAVRTSIAASLRSSCEATPSVLPLVAICCSPATQPNNVRDSSDSLRSSNRDTAAELGTAVQQDMFQDCLLMPPSPACSMYLTPGTTGPGASSSPAAADKGAAAAVGMANWSSMSGIRAGVGSMLGTSATAKSQDVWWRVTDDQQQKQQQQQQQQQQHIDKAGATALQQLQGSYAATPEVDMKPRDLSRCFEHVKQQPGDGVAASTPTELNTGSVRHFNSSSSSKYCFPLEPSTSQDGFTTARCCTLPAVGLEQQLSSQPAYEMQVRSEYAADVDQREQLLVAKCKETQNSQSADSSGSDLDSDLEWLHNYLDAKAMTAITPKKSSSKQLIEHASQQGNMGGQMVTTVAAATAGVDQSSTGIELQIDKEVWTIHNNWAATGMEAAVDALDADHAPIALCSITDAALSMAESLHSMGNEHGPLLFVDADCTDQLPRNTRIAAQQQQQQQRQHQQTGNKSSNSSSITGPNTAKQDTVLEPDSSRELDSVSSSMRDLPYEQALAVYSQLANTVKQQIDETTGSLLAKLDLDTPGTAGSQNSSDRSSSDSGAELRSTTAESESAAVTCKRDVGLVVLSPHNACGRWQSSSARAGRISC